MTEKRKRKKTIAEIEAEVEEELRNDPNVRLLEERIAYHRAKLAEERERRSRPWYRRLGWS